MKLSVLSVTCALGLGLFGCGSDSESPKDSGLTKLDSAVVKDGPVDSPHQPVDTTTGPDTAVPTPDVPMGEVALPKLDTAPIEASKIDSAILDAAAPIDGAVIDTQVSEAAPLRYDSGVVVIDGGIKLNTNYVELNRLSFQTTIDGKKTDLYTIRNSKGMFAKITNLGAKLEQIVVPDRDGVLGDVILGYDSIDKVKNGQGSMGAFIGRYANRIGDGKFTLDGTTYSVAINEAATSSVLHGGAKGGRFRVYDATQISDSQVQMSLTYLDAEDADAAKGITGFPGNLEVKVLYSITEQNEIKLEYSAKTDKKTVINFTGHSFWNLGNSPNVTILDHIVKVNADKVLAISSRLLPTGELRDVTGTPMDFRTAKAFGKDYKADYDLLNAVGGTSAGVAGGYDNHYALNKTTPGALEFAASAYEPVSGRKLEVWSTEPGMQLFTGTNLIGQVPRDVGKGGTVYQKYYGFCMEPSHFPDSPNQPTFPTTTLNAGETYEGKIVYKFSVGP